MEPGTASLMHAGYVLYHWATSSAVSKLWKVSLWSETRGFVTHSEPARKPEQFGLSWAELVCGVESLLVSSSLKASVSGLQENSESWFLPGFRSQCRPITQWAVNLWVRCFISLDLSFFSWTFRWQPREWHKLEHILLTTRDLATKCMPSYCVVNGSKPVL